MTEKPAENAAATSPSEEAKRKFREALERKKQNAQSRPGQMVGESSIHGTHGVAGGKRDFTRRKSG